MAYPEPVGGETEMDGDAPTGVTSGAHGGVWSTTRKVIVGIVGGVVTIAGVIAIPLPIVPSAPILLAGLAILSTEFESVRRRTDRVREKVRNVMSRRR